MPCTPRWIAALVLQLACTAAAAQGWPARPLKMMVPQAAGGAPDVVARVVCERLAQKLGQPVLVENRAGDASIGAQAVVRATADGYLYLFAPASLLAINPHLMKTVPYDVEKDFVGVAMVGMSPLALAVAPGLGARTLSELIELAKSQPGKVAFASPGQRTLPGFLVEVLRVRGGVPLLHVPYKGSQGMIDTIAGRTQATVQGIPTIAGPVERGELRALAVSSAKRLPELPGVPTLSETLPGLEVNGWFAVVAPRGTPSEPIRRMNLELDRLLLEPDLSSRLRALGIYTEGPSTPEEVDAFVRGERERWGTIVRELKIERE